VTIKHIGALLTLLVGMVLTAACGTSSATPPISQNIRETSVQFSWFHDVEFIGFYEATRNGTFTAQGVNVRLDGGGFDADGNYIDPVSRVMNGSAEFGVAGADVVLRAREAGQPLVAVASIYQRSPVVLISLPETGVNRPEDLVGKRVGTQPSTITVGILFEALLRSKGIALDSIIGNPNINFGSVDALFNNEVDVMQGFITNQAIQARLRNSEVNLMLMGDYGIDFYSNVIFTTEQMIQDNPAVVQGVVMGLIHGLNSAVSNPDAAAVYALDNYVADGSPDPAVRDVQTQGLLASVPLINPPNSRPGLMTADVWQYAHDTLLAQGLLTNSQDIDSAFTLDFANQSYAGS
jgi:ABC-type nitrate/sulfonate/bicarbonate transport system substrate-binding protein